MLEPVASLPDGVATIAGDEAVGAGLCTCWVFVAGVTGFCSLDLSQTKYPAITTNTKITKTIETFLFKFFTS